MKKCTKCGLPRPETEFSPMMSCCKSCKAAYERLRQERLKKEKKKYLNPDRARPLEKQKAMSPEDWIKLWPKVGNKQYLLLFDLMQSCGLRANEALPLTEEWFDFKAGTVTIHTLKQRGAQEEHVIFVRPDLLVAIEKRLAWSRQNTVVSKFLFPMSYKMALRQFKEAAAAAGLNPSLALHSLRHLLGYRLVGPTGGNLLQIGAALRHSNPMGVTARYVHLNPRRLKAIMEETWKDQPHIWEAGSAGKEKEDG